MHKNIYLIVLLFVCTSISTYAENSTTASSQGYKPTTADFADVKTNSTNKTGYSGWEVVSDNTAKEGICPELKIAINRLEELVNAQSVSVDKLTASDWLNIIQTYKQEPAYKNLLPTTPLSDSSNRCARGSFYLTFDIKHMQAYSQSGSFYYNMALMDTYLYTAQGNKLASFCKKMTGSLSEACYININNLADYFYNNVNIEQAIDLYIDYSKKDNSGYAQRQLGYIYAKGIGINININSNAAAYWYNQALLLDRKKKNEYETKLDLTNLGSVYFQSQNYIDAFNAFLEAAKMGYSEAQLDLASCYAQGNGTLQDNKNAYAWVSVAIAQGLSDSGRQSDAEDLRHSLVNELYRQNNTGKDLKDAQVLAQQYYQLYILHQKPASPSFSERLNKAIHAFNS